MSIVAEFARILHEKDTPAAPRALTPVSYPAREQKLHDIRAVIFDVYGTLVRYWRPEFATQEGAETYLRMAMRRVGDFLMFTDFLRKVDPSKASEQTLQDFYHGLIALNHDKSKAKGVDCPEIRIERVWETIIRILMRHGYDPAKPELGEIDELAGCAAFYYNFHSLGRGFYPGVVPALQKLGAKGIKLGIVSNAQFYTPIDLTLFCRDQSSGELDDYTEIFDTDLIFYSYEHGVAKPGRVLFEKLYDALYELDILPSQALLVGNDISADISPAHDIGMATAFFAGDEETSFRRDMQDTEVPDITFTHWEQLPDMVFLHEGKRG